ncbi:hypothetical protein E2C01_052850 [Portunus trituberculatus]|uniref:Uncharacterized protein n=1 Tax=Portunus trituberculatus TaxID=210409 RepID=A0A5B7GEU8_PORTR|nr:hypothetical protein [Portunus trituberculatus]
MARTKLSRHCPLSLAPAPCPPGPLSSMCPPSLHVPLSGKQRKRVHPNTRAPTVGHTTPARKAPMKEAECGGATLHHHHLSATCRAARRSLHHRKRLSIKHRNALDLQQNITAHVAAAEDHNATLKTTLQRHKHSQLCSAQRQRQTAAPLTPPGLLLPLPPSLPSPARDRCLHCFFIIRKIYFHCIFIRI